MKIYGRMKNSIQKKKNETSVWEEGQLAAIFHTDYVIYDFRVSFPKLQTITLKKNKNRQNHPDSDSDSDSDREHKKKKTQKLLTLKQMLDQMQVKKKRLMIFDMDEYLYNAFEMIKKAMSKTTLKEKKKQGKCQ